MNTTEQKFYDVLKDYIDMPGKPKLSGIDWARDRENIDQIKYTFVYIDEITDPLELKYIYIDQDNKNEDFDTNKINTLLGYEVFPEFSNLGDK